MQKNRFAALIVFALVLALGSVVVSAASQTVTIRVEGMHCGGCASSIEKKLKATDGVEEVRVSFEKGEAWIKYDDQKITVTHLREVINSTGFKALEEKAASRAGADESCCASGQSCCTGGSCCTKYIARR